MSTEATTGVWHPASAGLPTRGVVVVVLLRDVATPVTGYVTRKGEWQLIASSHDRRTHPPLFWSYCIPTPLPLPDAERQRVEYLARVSAPQPQK